MGRSSRRSVHLEDVFAAVPGCRSGAGPPDRRRNRAIPGESGRSARGSRREPRSRRSGNRVPGSSAGPPRRPEGSRGRRWSGPAGCEPAAIRVGRSVASASTGSSRPCPPRRRLTSMPPYLIGGQKSLLRPCTGPPGFRPSPSRLTFPTVCVSIASSRLGPEGEMHRSRIIRAATPPAACNPSAMDTFGSYPRSRRAAVMLNQCAVVSSRARKRVIGGSSRRRSTRVRRLQQTSRPCTPATPGRCASPAARRPPPECDLPDPTPASARRW